MATVTLPRPIPTHRPSSNISTPTITPPSSLEDVRLPTEPITPCASVPVHNKHIPACPTGPAKSPSDLETPPPSPGAHNQYKQQSILFPPDGFKSVGAGPLHLYNIEAEQVANAIEFNSSQPLPPPSLVFPWFHGLHPLNHMQQAFFTGRRRTIRKPPSCLRGITLVKADGDLSVARLKGAISPSEFMQDSPMAEFIDADPREGFSVRNFQIQAPKMVLVSDIIVYGEDSAHTRRVAWRIASAQHQWRESNNIHDEPLEMYNTFVCVSPFETFENQFAHLVAVDHRGFLTGNILDFVQQERREMWDMTQASEISHNVFMGPTPEQGSIDEERFDILIECSDMGRLNPDALRDVANCTDETVNESYFDFPSSGSILPPTWSQNEVDDIVATCSWIYHIAHGIVPESDDKDQGNMFLEEIVENKGPERKVLIHCADGYTESSMLGLAYFSYSTGQSIPSAWLNLHTEKGRNFFAYPTDVALLKAMAPKLLLQSPACANYCPADIMTVAKSEPEWLPGLDGSLPSRVLDYLYLGNLGHANNPSLLRELGICQLLSVGESASWREGDLEKWGSMNICSVQGVQDNGIDPLTDEFTRCLEFIDRGRRNGVATLVHCRVGVSRSATICIAEVMRSMAMSFPRAYCFVRARRLNVIIQPHLLFAYELMRLEDVLRRNDDETSTSRELEWGEITREIALMNRPYSR